MIQKGKRNNKRKKLLAKRAASRVLTVDDIAARLGVGRNKAYELVNSGQIPALRFGRRWLIPEASFERMMSI